MSYKTTLYVPPQFTAAHWSRIVSNLRFTAQQANIVAMILQGKSDKEIGDELGLRLPTIRAHLSGVFIRLDVHDRVALVLHMWEIAGYPSGKTT